MTEFKNGKYYVDTESGQRYTFIGTTLFPMEDSGIDFNSYVRNDEYKDMSVVECDIDGMEIDECEQEPVKLSDIARGEPFYLSLADSANINKLPLVRFAWDDYPIGDTARFIPCCDENTEGIKLLLPSTIVYPE